MGVPCCGLFTGHVKELFQNLADTFYKYIAENVTCTWLVFDCYYEYSIKSTTRKESAGNVTHRHQFSLATPLPAPDVVTLTSTENKVQHINIICEYLVKKVAERMTSKRFIVIRSFNILQEICAKVLITKS